ncbi:unnamed protein product [Enterobius vermicularis]|uniref:Uncharacterized protein n=1 Tax=Enterobius vermicularis TaxID=51028 RepID=A0A0N4VCT4_ENTVE|nr:unnamed protein product [Enterobius vermicularis]
MTVSLVGSHNILEIRENRFNVIKKEMLQKEPRSIKIYPVEIRRKLPTATELPRGDEEIEPEPLSFKDAADADVTSAELEPENSWIKPRRPYIRPPIFRPFNRFFPWRNIFHGRWDNRCFGSYCNRRSNNPYYYHLFHGHNFYGYPARNFLQSTGLLKRLFRKRGCPLQFGRYRPQVSHAPMFVKHGRRSRLITLKDKKKN